MPIQVRDNRSVRYGFAGLVTSSRREFFEAFFASVYPGKCFELGSVGKRGVIERVMGRLNRSFGLAIKPRSVRAHLGTTTLWESQRGRQFPGKSWDQEYFDFMCDVQFVLCPPGDCVWSYRFFEAAMCGAIPVIEEPCPAYEGFRYRTLADIANATYDQEAAEYNYSLCLKRVTVPRDELEREIARLICLHGG